LTGILFRQILGRIERHHRPCSRRNGPPG
jgi:hypothetical protein